MFSTLPLDMIVRNPNQPRKQFDAVALDELAASIQRSGLIEPLIVRPVGDTYVLVAGERRWRACHLISLAEVECKILDMPEGEAFVLSVAENVNRVDMTPMEEAEAYDTLQSTYGHPLDEVAGMFGKSAEYVRIRLSFLDLVPDARHLLERGQIGPNLARYVAPLADGNQRAVVNRWARGEFRTEIEATHFCRSLAEAESAGGLFDVAEPTLEKRLEVGRAGTKARRTLDKVDALMTLLSELADTAPGELAEALGSDLNHRLAQVERITGVTQRARQQLRKAKAHAAASSLDLSSDAMPV